MKIIFEPDENKIKARWFIRMPINSPDYVAPLRCCEALVAILENRTALFRKNILADGRVVDKWADQ